MLSGVGAPQQARETMQILNDYAVPLTGLLVFALNTAITYWLKSVTARHWLITFLKALVGALEKSTPMLVVLVASTMLSGCAGTFEEARLARHPAGAKTLTASAPLSDRCVKLSDRIRWEGATEVGGLALTGATGLSAIPIDGKTERIAIVSATTGIVVGTAIVHFLTESDRAAFVTECAQ